MRTAIISDIHGNFEALKSVHSDIQNSNVDKIVCLGDIVGHGPQPEESLLFLIDNEIPCIAGDHEIAVLDNMRLERFSTNIKESLLLTRRLLSEKTLNFIRRLPICYSANGMYFVHGAPPNAVFQNITSLDDDDILWSLYFIKEQFVFVGHTHETICYCTDGEELDVRFPRKGLNDLNPQNRYLINVGSVGQPNGGGLTAKYVIFDDKNFNFEMRSVTYDIEKLARIMKERMFPENKTISFFINRRKNKHKNFRLV